MSKEIDKLIEQILLERVSMPFLQNDFNDILSAFNVAAGIEEPDNQVDDKDIDNLKKTNAGLYHANKEFNAMIQVLANAEREKNSAEAQTRLNALFNKSTEAGKKKINALRANPDLAKVPPQDLEKVFTRIDAEYSVPSLDVAQKASEVEKDKKSWKGGFMPATTLDVFNKFFVGTTSVKGRIEKLIEYSDLFAGAHEGDTAKIQTLKAKDISEVLSASMILKYSAQCVKEINSLEAGKFFETMTALLMGGGVVGSAAGASDVLVSKDLNVQTSQKLYKNLGGIKQAEGTTSAKGKGIYGDTAAGKPIYYVIGIKTGEEGEEIETSRNQNIAKVKIYVVALVREGDRGSRQYVLYGQDGKTKIGDVSLKKPKTGGIQVMIGETLETNPTAGFVGELVVAAPGDIGAFRSIDKMINTAFDNIATVTLTAVREVYKKLENLKNNTTSYTQATDLSKQMDAADNVIANFENVQDNLIAVVKDFSTETGPRTQTKEKAKKLASLEESKSSLDQLVESIIKQTLLK